MASKPGFLIKLIVLSIVPVIIVPFAVSNLGSVSVINAATQISAGIIFPVYLWSLGIPLAIMLSMSSSTILVGDIESHRMLILGSKPFGRVQFLLARFFGAYLHGMFLSSLTIVCAGVFAVLVTTGKIDHFLTMLPFFGSLMFYGSIICFLFTGIGFTISALTKNSARAGVIAAIIAIAAFLAPYFLRTFASDIYTNSYLYFIDIGYHLGNSLVFCINIFNSLPNLSNWQSLIAVFTNVFSSGTGIDSSQGFGTGGLDLAGYCLPGVSISILLILTIVLLTLGSIRFVKRDIT